jgi:hypothetical protein
MDKKDIYEHLAKIYLDASLKKKKRRKREEFYKKPLVIGIFAAIVLIGGVILTYRRSSHRSFSVALSNQTALVLYPDYVKINFNFDPAKKEIFTVDFNRLDLNPFRRLAFSARRMNTTGSVSLRVEWINAFKEKSEVYIKDIPSHWQEFVVNLSDFRNISDWSEVTQLLLSTEEWNATRKSDVVYIDNIRLLK